MATEKPRFTITLDPDTLRQVHTFKDINGIATQSSAIRQLVELGIQDLIQSGDLEIEKKAPPVSDEALKIACAFDAADADHKTIVRAALSSYLIPEDDREAIPAQKGSDTKLA